MKLINAVKAYAAVVSLSSREHNYKTAHALMITKEKLSPHVQFYSENEMKLVEEFGERDEKGKVIYRENGRFNIAGDYEEYLRKKHELDEVTLDDIEPIRAPAPDRITVEQLEALSGVIEFEA